MKPKTLHGFDQDEVVSALQKAIRRSEEREAMCAALELAISGKATTTRLLNRLVTILHEDLDVVSHPAVLSAVEATLRQFVAWRDDATKEDAAWMLLGTVIRLMCRCPKSREGDHFASVCIRDLLDGRWSGPPDHALDKHTSRGRQLGRGMEHFLTVGAVLSPAPEPDPYAAEASRAWLEESASGSPSAIARVRAKRGRQHTAPDMFGS